MQKNEWKGQNVTAEDVAASLKPLMDEYLEGESVCTGDAIAYTLRKGRCFLFWVDRKKIGRMKNGAPRVKSPPGASSNNEYFCKISILS